MWIDRLFAERLGRIAASRPAVLLTGARQTGKSSLLRHAFPDARLINLDHPLVAETAARRPGDLLDDDEPATILDEVQYAPQLLRELKLRIDANRQQYGRWLLTGSQRFPLMQGISESLAGRISVLHLETLSAKELRCSKVIEPDRLPDYQWLGGYPELWANPGLDAEDFFNSYIHSYIERDLHQIINVGDSRSFAIFLRSCALRAGQLVNFSDLARQVGITSPTAKKWLGALETSGLVCLLPPYHGNLGKRLTKAPKLFFTDHGLLGHLVGVRDVTSWRNHPQRGALWENLILGELLKTRALTPGRDLFFYRDHGGAEVDFLIDRGSTIELIEAKASQRPDPRKLNFDKVTPLFPDATVSCLVAAPLDTDLSLSGAGYRLADPLRSELDATT